MKNCKFSIIIPVYNGEKYIERCIKSIINQTYKNLEIIIVNDGSLDNTEKKCKEIIKYDRRIKYIFQENSGVSKARNNGIKYATGDYVSFIDADDYIRKNCFEELANIIKTTKAEIIKYGYERKKGIITKKYKFSICTDKLIESKNYFKDVYPYIFTSYDLSNVWNAVIKKAIINQLKFNENLTVGEDFLFMTMAVIKSKSMYFDKKIFYEYCFNSNSIMAPKNNEKDFIKLTNNLEAINKIDLMLDHKFCDSGIERINKSIENYMINHFNLNNYNTYKKNLKTLLDNLDNNRMINQINNKIIYNINHFKNLQKKKKMKKLKNKILDLFKE